MHEYPTPCKSLVFRGRPSSPRSPVFAPREPSPVFEVCSREGGLCLLRCGSRRRGRGEAGKAVGLAARAGLSIRDYPCDSFRQRARLTPCEQAVCEASLMA